MTTQESAPTAPAPPPAPPIPAIALPRPNPGPVPWSDPTPSAPSALALSLALAIAALVGAGVVIRQRRLARRRGADPLVAPGEGLDEGSPARRLRFAALAVRAALVAAFGPTWNARTTEEVARDPALADRFGPEVAQGIVAFLQQVDRVRFGGEECEDVDALIDSSRPLMAQIRESGGPGAGSAVTSSPLPGRSAGRRRRRSRSRRSGA